MPRQKKDFLLNPVTIIIVLIIIITAVFHFYQNSRKIDHLQNKIKNIENKIESSEAENKKLKKQIINSDNHEYVEEMAREKLGLIKEGEKLLIPVEKKETELKTNNSE